MSENQNSENVNTPPATEDNSEGGGRRRRRGRGRRGDNRNRPEQSAEAGADSPTQGSQPIAEGSSETRQGGSQQRNQRGDNRPHAERAPQTEATTNGSSNTDKSDQGASPDGGADGNKSGGRSRNRRGRGRNQNRDRAPQATNTTNDSAVTKPTEATNAEAKPDEAKKEQGANRRRQNNRNDNRSENRTENHNDNRNKPPQEKKERPKRGSVLERRAARLGQRAHEDEATETTIVPQEVHRAINVDDYIAHLRGWQREVVTTIRTIIKANAPDAEESILWSQPVFALNGPMCYVKAFSDHVNFGFWRGTELDDELNLLTGDVTMMRHITLKSAKDIKREKFEQMVRQAVKLNKERGDPTLSS